MVSKASEKCREEFLHGVDNLQCNYPLSKRHSAALKGLAQRCGRPAGMGMTAGHLDTTVCQCIVHTRKAKQRLELAGRWVTQGAMA